MAQRTNNALEREIVAAVQHGEKSGTGARILLIGVEKARRDLVLEAIASEVGRELYQVDLSKVTSKYIGETEKNLNRIFDRADALNAILFFDEADALFGKRTDVKDSHDRFANIEVSYLLRRLENYKGIAILATNLHEHIDSAFLRRCSFVLHFPKTKSRRRKRA